VIKLNSNFILLSEKDNVAVASIPLKNGDKIKIKNSTIEIVEDIDFGHKIAMKDIKKGDEVIKYGEVIGIAKQSIKAGELVHIHNLKSRRAEKDE
jgi:altronate dehydratase